MSSLNGLSDRRTAYRTTRDAIHAAIAELTATLGHYPSPVQVATHLGISRQLLHKHILVLERAGMVKRLYHGHALQALTK